MGNPTTATNPERRSPLSDQRQQEDGRIARYVEGDGDHEILFRLVGQGKEEAACDLGDGNARQEGVRQDKGKGAEQDGRPKAPPSEEPEQDAPEEDLLRDGGDKASRPIISG